MSTTTLSAPATDVISLDQFTPNDAIDNATLKFIAFYLGNPGDAISKAFTHIITSKAATLETDVAAFFSSYPAYRACTLDSYLAGMIYQAEHADTAALPADQKKYGLSTLVKLLGGQWPDGLPDITLLNPGCSASGGVFTISFTLDFTTLNFENALIAANVRKLVTDASVQATLTSNYQPSVFIFETKLSVVLDNIQLPLGNSQTLNITRPTISLDITPEFKYVVFSMSGDIPATIFNTPVDVDISLIVDNDEASIGASIAGNNASLPAPPGVKGLHFDQIGACMGLFFEPPGFAFGLQGKFHIGDSTAGNIVDLDDDSFALVCEYVEEAIAPKYVAFYVPKLDINKVIELFTNANPNIDVPVKFSELGFRWSTGVNDSVALPDGTLSQAGWGFSADVDVFAFQFHGDANLDLNTGLTANMEMAPLSLGKIFKLSGDGKGYSVKIDANGNPIRNNQVLNTQALQDAAANATTKQLVAPGGPVLIINTLSMPILHLNAKASLFDVAAVSVAADINKNGIAFELDYGVVLTTKMVCNLSDYHNLYGEFGYHIDHSIPLPAIGGESLGTIPLKADISAHLSVKTSTSDVTLSLGGNFHFEGYSFSFGDYSADIHISKISDFVAAMVQAIVDNAKAIFSQLLDTAEQWAAAAGKGIITGFDDAGKVLNTAYHKTKEEMVSILKGAGFAVNDILNGLKNGYGVAQKDAAILMKAMGYGANEIASGLKNAYNATTDSVADALKAAGFKAEEVAGAIKNAWNCAQKDVTWAMMMVGFTGTEIVNGLRSAFNATSDSVADAMKQIGYKAEDVANAIKNSWNCGINDVTWAMQQVGYTGTEIVNGLRSAFNATSDAVAAAMKQFGYKVEDIANAIRKSWNCKVSDVVWALQQVGYSVQDIAAAVKGVFGDAAQDLASAFKQFGIGAQDAADAIKNVFVKAINDTATILKQAGYAASDVASALKNAFNVGVDAVASAMKAVGYAGDEVKNAFEDLGGDFKNFADTAWKKLSDPDTWNPTKW